VVRRQSPLHGLTTPVDRFRDATLLTLYLPVTRTVPPLLPQKPAGSRQGLTGCLCVLARTI
jgi:hypothetical protein